MDYVQSQDGTPIAFQRIGKGDPLILVHGSNSDHTRWGPIVDELKDHFSLFLMDRRGRGKSGDSASYSLVREYEDLVAVIDSAGRSVHVLGHSYGALCALEAARMTNRITKMILYEPPMPLHVTIDYGDVMERIQSLIDKGNRAEAVLTFFREVGETPPHELDQLQTLASWPGRVAAAHTLPREVEAERNYVWDPEKFRHLKTRTLLMVGSESPLYYKAVVEVLSHTLTNSRTQVLQNQRHLAINTAPRLFAQEVLNFLWERD